MTNIPVQAVPAKAQARGSRYQGEFWIKNAEKATAATVVATAPHARHGLMSNTLEGIDLMTSVSETSSGSSAPMVRYPRASARSALSASEREETCGARSRAGARASAEGGGGALVEAGAQGGGEERRVGARAARRLGAIEEGCNCGAIGGVVSAGLRRERERRQARKKGKRKRKEKRKRVEKSEEVDMDGNDGGGGDGSDSKGTNGHDGDENESSSLNSFSSRKAALLLHSSLCGSQSTHHLRDNWDGGDAA